MKRAYLESQDDQTDFQRNLRALLVAAGVEFVEKREDATAILRISKDESGRRVLSVSARNTPREYEIYYTVTYAVLADGKELLPPQTLSLTRDYSFDEQVLLAKEHEEEILRQAMAKDLAGVVMRSLSSL
jgi:LPS-assembly lipoprotein